MSEKRFTEAKLLENLDAYTAHADALALTTHSQIFAYRAFDLRDRFPAPFPDFKNALEALQSDDAYLPDMACDIVAYRRDGQHITIPPEFYTRHHPRFETRAEALAWVQEQQAVIARGDALSKLRAHTLGNPADPLEKQVDDAMAHKDRRIIDPSENDVVCEQVTQWLMTHTS